MFDFINSKLLLSAFIAGGVLLVVCYLQRKTVFSVQSDKRNEERLKQVKFGAFFDESGNFKLNLYKSVVIIGILITFFLLTYLIYTSPFAVSTIQP